MSTTILRDCSKNIPYLVADSSTATGLAYAAPAASGFVGCQLTNAANISASNNTATALTFDTEIFDTDAFHSTASNTSRITIPAGKGGKYLFNLKVTWQGNATGIRFSEFFVNGTDRYRVMTIQATTSGNPDVTAYNCSFILNLVATDYVEARCQQSSGGSLNLVGNTEGGTLERFTLTAQFLGA